MIETTRDIAACRAIRHEVFVIEQHVSEQDEWDDMDDQAIHLLARDTNGAALGTARLLVLDDIGKIGRVAVRKAARGTGMGAALIRASMDEFRKIPGVSRAKLSAQTHAIGFYEKLGFTAYGPEYGDAGIPHRDMTCDL